MKSNDNQLETNNLAAGTMTYRSWTQSDFNNTIKAKVDFSRILSNGWRQRLY